ncbi:MAG: aminopeptidase P family N-terminal domain-containing protein, partial [bacterium]|nr:aminopeptidase P family N-terminal domain-containing protein [bacterium]
MTSSYKLRLEYLRQCMNENKIDLLLIRSTDCFLNENVTKEESQRVYITGFTGSIGDALITPTRAILFVDGRYTLQAKTECPDMEIQVATLGTSIEKSWLKAVKNLQIDKQQTFGIEGDRISVALFMQIQKSVSAEKIIIFTKQNSLVDKTRQKLGPPITESAFKIWAISPKLSGKTTKKRLAQVNSFFKEQNVEAISLVLLDEIAWLTNLRGNQFPYQTTFAAKALAFTNEVWLCVDQDKLNKVKSEAGIKIIASSKWNAALRQHFINKSLSIAVDPNTTTESVAQDFKKAGAVIKLISSPFGPLKALKTPAEILHMRESFVRADHVVYKTQKWVNKNLAKKNVLSEADVDIKVRKEFIKSGAIGLSFKPICASAKNGAVIHYGTPSEDVKLSKGSLFLLDTGGSYKGGYATDLTRTFLVGDKKTKAKSWQKKLFTCVLQA